MLALFISFKYERDFKMLKCTSMRAYAYKRIKKYSQKILFWKIFLLGVKWFNFFDTLLHDFVKDFCQNKKQNCIKKRSKNQLWISFAKSVAFCTLLILFAQSVIQYHVTGWPLTWFVFARDGVYTILVNRTLAAMCITV